MKLAKHRGLPVCALSCALHAITWAGCSVDANSPMAKNARGASGATALSAVMPGAAASANGGAGANDGASQPAASQSIMPPPPMAAANAARQASSPQPSAANDSDAGPSPARWTSTWGTALIGADGASARSLSQMTLRQIIHTSVGGERVRVRFSNAFGSSALRIVSAHVAQRKAGASIALDSDRALTFAGAVDVTIAAGAMVTSDPVTLRVPQLSDLAVSIALAQGTVAETLHGASNQTSYISSAGDVAGAEDLSDADKISAWYFLAGVDVSAVGDASAVVALGDSITDGNGSTLDGNARWPDVLARRAALAGRALGVVNEGYAGNQVLSDDSGGPAALSRFDRDVLPNSGLTHMLLLEGINDIGARNVSADALIAGLRQLIAKARQAGLHVIGATLTPDQGFQYYDDAHERVREQVNTFIRGSDSQLDAFIDFDAAVRDPNAPTRLRADCDSGDHIHPSDAGYEVMADAIDLTLLQ